MSDGRIFVWYDKTADDQRVWCVRRDGVTVRASRVEFPDGCSTAFLPSGYAHLQPGGPRGIILTTRVILTDEAPI